MKKAPAPPVTRAEEIHVKLKPLAGLQPPVYVGLLWGVAALALLYLALFHTGLTRPGEVLEVHSVPSGAAVWFGDQLLGATPLRRFVAQGQADLRVERPGFETSVTPLSLGNQVLLAWAFPAQRRLEVTLTGGQPAQLLRDFVARLGQWSAAGPFNESYQAPPLFSDYAADARAAGLGEAELRAQLLTALPFVADGALYSDLGRALGLWTQGPPEDPAAQEGLWQGLLGPLNERPNFARWLLVNAPPARRGALTQSDWFKSREAARTAALSPADAPRAGAPVRLSPDLDGAFIPFNGGETLWGSEEYPARRHLEPFWLAEAEVSIRDWDRYAAATGWQGPAATDEAFTGGRRNRVSWTEAQAFVAWLNSRSPTWRFDLPSEAEWDWAFQALPSPLRQMDRGVSEWLRDPGAPAAGLVEVWGPDPAWPESWRAAFSRAGLRGGHWAAQPDQPAARARAEVSSASAYLGFRLMARRR